MAQQANQALPQDQAPTSRSGHPVIDADMPEEEIETLIANATRATALLKAIGSEARLLILCYLSSGEKSVSDLERLLSSRQSAVSQQLGRLRLEGLVEARRDGKQIFYSIADPRVRQILDVVYDLFCREE